MNQDFHSQLSSYIKSKDSENATKVVLNELGLCLAKDRENFIEILNNAGISASPSDTDLVLIEKFVQNAHHNKRLLLGASYLIHYRNKITNFDGEDEVSDMGIKNTYYALAHHFNGEEEEENAEGEDQSNWIGTALALGKKILGGKDFL